MNIVDKILFDPITKGLKMFSRGGASVFSTSPQGMSDEVATQLGYKAYFHGTTYKNGNAPTVSNNAGAFSNYRSHFIPYQTQDGTWRLKVNITGSVAGGSINSFTWTIAGVTFKNTTNHRQCLAGAIDVNPRECPNHQAINNTSTIIAYWPSAFSVSSADWAVNGDVELESKPTWAY